MILNNDLGLFSINTRIAVNTLSLPIPAIGYYAEVP